MADEESAAEGPEGSETEAGSADAQLDVPAAAGDDAQSGGHDRAVYEVPVEISAVLGTARIPVSQLLKMGRGAVLELDRLVGDPVEIFVNKQMVARGEVVVVEERLGVTLLDTVRDPTAR